MKRHKRQSRLLELVLITLIVFLMVSFISPTKQIIAQRSKISGLDGQLAAEKAKKNYYQSQVKNLNDPEFISELARDQFGLVKPGEKAYVLIGAPKNPLPSAVYPAKKQGKPTLWQKIKDSVDDFLNQ